MFDVLERLRALYLRQVWEVEPATVPWYRAAWIRTARIVQGVSRELVEGQLTLRAMSLVYTTLLSLVPLLAVSFSVLKGFGVHNQVAPLLDNFLRPLGPTGAEVTQRIMAFVENLKVGVLGSVGLALLMYTVVSLLQKVEADFNHIWQVQRPRRLSQRFSEYLSVILVGPVLVFTAVGITASMMSSTVVQALAAVEPLGSLLGVFAGLMPYVLICAAFTFVYVFVPNAQVRLRSALVGGVVAGVLWETTGWAFAAFVMSATKSYAAIYSGLAVLLVFMIWVYVSWLILLTGAQVAYFHQHPGAVRAREAAVAMSGRSAEALTLEIMFLVGHNYLHGGARWTHEALAQRLEAPMETVARMLGALTGAGLLVETGDEPAGYLPARDIEAIPVRDVIDVARGTRPSAMVPHAAPVLQRVEHAIGAALGSASVRDLVQVSGDAQVSGGGTRNLVSSGVGGDVRHE